MLSIIFILLASIKISTTHGSRTCIPSTCGSQKISYPYNCGDQNYQLSCIGNKTYLGAPYDKYLVTNINYDNYTINIVNTELASGKCNLPSQAITFGSFPNGFRLVDEPLYGPGRQWVTFINCSEKQTTLDSSDRPVIIPCLSQNNRFIYVVRGSFIYSLANSCSYLTMVPINIPEELDLLNIGDNIFQLLKYGFSISWGVVKIKRSKIIHGCLQEVVPQAKYHMAHVPTKNERLKYPFHIEFEFLNCIRRKDIVLSRYSIAFVVFLDIITFYLGTIGYMAPELISRSFGLISYKSDVYSFGMLLLEMAGGRRNYDSRVENSSQAYYPSWIYDRLNQQTNLEVLDHEVEIVDVERKLCKVGLWCIQMSPTSRPTMNRVVEMLEDDADNVEMPPKPFFFSSSQQTTREQNSFDMSFNEISTIYESE